MEIGERQIGDSSGGCQITCVDAEMIVTRPAGTDGHVILTHRLPFADDSGGVHGGPAAS